MKKSIKKSLVAKLAGASIAASIFLGFATNAQASTSQAEAYSMAYDEYTQNLGSEVNNEGAYMESVSLRSTLASDVMSVDKASYTKTRNYISTKAKSDDLVKKNQSNTLYIKSQVFNVMNGGESMSTKTSGIKVLNKIYDVATIKTNKKVMSTTQFKTLMYQKNGWEAIAAKLYTFVHDGKNMEQTVATINGRNITVAELKSLRYKAIIEPRLINIYFNDYSYTAKVKTLSVRNQWSAKNLPAEYKESLNKDFVLADF